MAPVTTTDPGIAVAAQGISLHFGGIGALREVDITVSAGERRIILGPNGAGKTSLFRVLSGETKPTSGRIFLYGEDITRLPVYRRAQLGLARTFQIVNLFPRLTVWENVALAVSGRGGGGGLSRPVRSNERVDTAIRQLLDRWSLTDISGKAVNRLAYGQQRRLEVVMALASEPSVLLLDEPTAGLSSSETEALVDFIGSLSRGVTLLMIEHDISAALSVADRITVLDRGRVIAEGSVSEIRQNQKVQDIYLGQTQP